MHVSLYLFWTSVSDLRSSVWYGEHVAVLKACLSSQQDFLVNKMAELGAEAELPQRRFSVKEQQNGELTGKNKTSTKQMNIDQTCNTLKL